MLWYFKEKASYKSLICGNTYYTVKLHTSVSDKSETKQQPQTNIITPSIFRQETADVWIEFLQKQDLNGHFRNLLHNHNGEWII